MESNMKEQVKKGKKGLFHVIFSRIFVVFLLLALQVGFLAFMFTKLTHMVAAYTVLTIFAGILVVYILNRRENPAMKMSWMIIILVVPVFGALLYLFISLQIETNLIKRHYRMLIEETRPCLLQDEGVFAELEQKDKQLSGVARYLRNYEGYPVYKNTKATYFPVGEDKFKELLIQLEKAERFIFLEYFIVEEGYMWNSVLEILKRKVKEGVEVRFMYDGTCWISLLPYSYPKKMQALGIKCKMFAPVKPALSTYQNNRDHRKILVIDGKVGFTGGVNLADEYINKKERFGHWKDTAIMLEGDAVRSMTVMFLQMWNITEREGEENFGKYLLPAGSYVPEGASGFVMPYGDSPYNEENLAELVYMSILNTATSYVHIMTPYLILDNEMIQALTFAAKRGVEVIIIMPHIPDKWYAFVLAKTYYRELMDYGVKIYEYTPGFVHAKSFVSDDEKAVVGTINLDYRSLYLHYECAAYMYQSDVVADVERDFQETLAKSQLVTVEDCRKLHWFKKLCGRVLRLIAPLM
ncbi:cardiolipin synthase [Anaerolentibacter hominis]|uniref:cardiolipin synthase n=1 Tax=Anaerolentibacter hominis TaxID=3079009 RepID=UPI0031B86BEA